MLTFHLCTSLCIISINADVAYVLLGAQRHPPPGDIPRPKITPSLRIWSGVRVSVSFGLFRHAVSVCPSVTLNSVETRNIVSSKFFHHRVAKPFCLFPYQTSWQYSEGDAPNGDVEYRWGMQKSRF